MTIEIRRELFQFIQEVFLLNFKTTYWSFAIYMIEFDIINKLTKYPWFYFFKKLNFFFFIFKSVI